MDIAAWLRGLELERYEAAFRANEIDASVLPRLTAEDLKDLGVTLVATVGACLTRLWRSRRSRRLSPMLRFAPMRSAGS